MKTPYSTPLFVVESFEMTQSIAKDCGTDIPVDNITTRSPLDCAWKLGMGNNVFLNGNANCNLDGENMGFACYNNPTALTTAFHS